MRPLKTAILISGSFAVVSTAYILLSDEVTHHLFRDPLTYQAVQSAKGMGYVIVVALGLFGLSWGLLRRIEAQTEATQAHRDRLMLMERRVLAGTLAATIVHDVKNLSGAIRANLQFLQKTAALDATADEAVSDSLQAVDQLLHLHKRLQKVAEKRLADNLEQADLSELVETAVSLVRTHERVRSCHVVLDLPEQCPMPVYPNLVTHAVINLLLNAAQAVDDEGTVRVRLDIQADDHVDLIVEDDGPGIPEDQRETMLEPFASGSQTGTGLGLFSVSYCMAEHGGRVAIDESPLGGARVTLSFAKLTAKTAEAAGRPAPGELLSTGE